MISNKLLISILASVCLTNAGVINSSLPVSNDGRCGKGIAVCKEGFCCSKIGWCGNSDLHCKVEEGCQSEFGICHDDKPDETEPTDGNDVYEEITETTSGEGEDTDDEVDIIYGKCGVGYGSCKEGYCCSKWGWCGKSDLYCDIKQGCQTEFGICDTYVRDANEDSDDEGLPVSKDGKCGEGIAVCAEGFCCSKYGWCGQTDLYCNIEEGCQSEFGKCNPFNVDAPNEEVEVPAEKPKDDSTNTSGNADDDKDVKPIDDDVASDEEVPVKEEGKVDEAPSTKATDIVTTTVVIAPTEDSAEKPRVIDIPDDEASDPEEEEVPKTTTSVHETVTVVVTETVTYDDENATEFMDIYEI